jgi:hypothetical protein
VSYVTFLAVSSTNNIPITNESTSNLTTQSSPQASYTPSSIILFSNLTHLFSGGGGIKRNNLSPRLKLKFSGLEERIHSILLARLPPQFFQQRVWQWRRLYEGREMVYSLVGLAGVRTADLYGVDFHGVLFGVYVHG